MQTIQVVKKAHLGLVTALTFSPDSRGLVSVSFDSRARLTMIEQKGDKRTYIFMVSPLASPF
jgi:prolactin regulatory element-binding protein